MVELHSIEVQTNNRRSSKGNQLKWKRERIWYKADYTGYEGLAEYMVSGLIAFSNLKTEEYVHYKTEQIRYKDTIFTGCRSTDFMPEGGQLITLERLFRNAYGTSLYESIYRIPDVRERLLFLTEQTERMCGIRDFGIYLCKMLTIDAFFLNEDRHMHNIAVLEKDGEYSLCPFFDHGASLLADTTMDYPLSGDLYSLIDSVPAKTIAASFDDQLDAAEELYGRTVYFSFSKKNIEELLEAEKYYPEEVKERVKTILFDRMRKYSYLFEK